MRYSRSILVILILTFVGCHYGPQDLQALRIAKQAHERAGHAAQAQALQDVIDRIEKEEAERLRWWNSLSSTEQLIYQIHQEDVRRENRREMWRGVGEGMNRAAEGFARMGGAHVNLGGVQPSQQVVPRFVDPGDLPISRAYQESLPRRTETHYDRLRGVWVTEERP